MSENAPGAREGTRCRYRCRSTRRLMVVGYDESTWAAQRRDSLGGLDGDKHMGRPDILVQS